MAWSASSYSMTSRQHATPRTRHSTSGGYWSTCKSDPAYRAHGTPGRRWLPCPAGLVLENATIPDTRSDRRYWSVARRRYLRDVTACVFAANQDCSSADVDIVMQCLLHRSWCTDISQTFRPIYIYICILLLRVGFPSRRDLYSPHKHINTKYATSFRQRKHNASLSINYQPEVTGQAETVRRRRRRRSAASGHRRTSTPTNDDVARARQDFRSQKKVPRQFHDNAYVCLSRSRRRRADKSSRTDRLLGNHISDDDGRQVVDRWSTGGRQVVVVDGLDETTEVLSHVVDTESTGGKASFESEGRPTMLISIVELVSVTNSLSRVCNGSSSSSRRHCSWRVIYQLSRRERLNSNISTAVFEPHSRKRTRACGRSRPSRCDITTR